MGYRDNRPPDDDTYVVERDRERIVDRQVEQQQPMYTPPPAYPPGGGQVNVNASTPGYGGGYAAPVAYSPGPLYYARRVVVLLFGVLMALIGIRVILLLLGANQDNGLVTFVMNVTEPFIAPFRGIFTLDQVSAIGRSVLDVGALVALVGYFLLMVLIIAILRIADRDAARA